MNSTIKPHQKNRYDFQFCLKVPYCGIAIEKLIKNNRPIIHIKPVPMLDKITPMISFLVSGQYWIRTSDSDIMSVVLYQLS